MFQTSSLRLLRTMRKRSTFPTAPQLGGFSLALPHSSRKRLVSASLVLPPHRQLSVKTRFIHLPVFSHFQWRDVYIKRVVLFLLSALPFQHQLIPRMPTISVVLPVNLQAYLSKYIFVCASASSRVIKRSIFTVIGFILPQTPASPLTLIIALGFEGIGIDGRCQLKAAYLDCLRSRKQHFAYRRFCCNSLLI